MMISDPMFPTGLAHDSYKINEAVRLGLSDIVFLHVTKQNQGEKFTDHILTLHIDPEFDCTKGTVHVRNGIVIGIDYYALHIGEDFLLLRIESFRRYRWRLIQTAGEKFK